MERNQSMLSLSRYVRLPYASRGGNPADKAEPDALFAPLPREMAQAVVHACSYFLQLANITEDHYQPAIGVLMTWIH